MPTPSLQDTIDLIQTLHAGQRDKQGAPYWMHPYAVMLRLGPDAPLYKQQAALLHDVMEECDTTLDELRALGYEERTLAIVDLLTHRKNPSEKQLTGAEKNDWYREKVFALRTSGNIDAMDIKLADIQENTSGNRFAKLDTATQDILREKYLGLEAWLKVAIRDAKQAEAARGV